jgi:hypothetical protein
MPWFKVDDGFHGHPKVVELSLAAVGLWTLAGSWCAKYLTDGMVPTKTVTRLGGDASEAGELVAAELWLKAAGGFQFKDWHHYQPLKEAVEAERAAAQERMRKARAAKKGVQANNERTTADSSPEVPVTPSQSQSHPSTSSSTKKRGARKPEIPLPSDWAPKPAHVALARERGVDGRHEEAQFRAHAEANDRRQRDWDAAFRMWLGNSKPARLSGRLTPEERARQTLALANNFKEIE